MKKTRYQVWGELRNQMEEASPVFKQFLKQCNWTFTLNDQILNTWRMIKSIEDAVATDEDANAWLSAFKGYVNGFVKFSDGREMLKILKTDVMDATNHRSWSIDKNTKEERMLDAGFSSSQSAFGGNQ